jgi:carbonic anhydrase
VNDRRIEVSTPTTPTPAEAWAQLQQGNERFIADQSQHPRQDARRREELGFTQHPVAAVFACSDSRVAVEAIFDQGIGDVFVIRNAGQVVSDSALGSIEYAVGPLQVPVLVVITHEGCGAVRAAIDSQAADADPLPPHIASLIAPIVPAVREVAGRGGDAPLDVTSIDAAEVGRVHLRETVGELLRRSEMISQAVADGKLAIVGAIYRLVEGRVTTETVIGLDGH